MTHLRCLLQYNAISSDHGQQIMSVQNNSKLNLIQTVDVMDGWSEHLNMDRQTDGCTYLKGIITVEILLCNPIKNSTGHYT